MAKLKHVLCEIIDDDDDDGDILRAAVAKASKLTNMLARAD